jgi:hypothetical protein
LTAKRAHAWLFVGFEMILLDKIQHVDLAVTAFALTRVIEVVARTSACVIVSALSTLTARRHWPVRAGRGRAVRLTARRRLHEALLLSAFCRDLRTLHSRN